ncbi:GNAT family N-acetyltransferase [Candidatus Bipolaricaulota bacterium]
MSMIELVQVREEDLEELTRICIRSFHTDVGCGAPEEGGPPGYDSVEYQRRALESAHAYLKIMMDGRIVGGFHVLDDGGGQLYLSQLFLDPSCHRQGVGLRAMELMFERYPQAVQWGTDTPAWNMRTRPFYEKLGFKAVDEQDGLLFFKKSME